MKFTNQFLTLLVLAIFAFACNSPAGEKAETGEAKEAATATNAAMMYEVQPTASQVNWTGSKPTGQHTGTLQISGGNLAVVNNNITAGSFTIDMGSLTVTDLEGEQKGKLEGHLKSPDFFDVSSHPKATFEIVSVTAGSDVEDATHTITGNLMMNGNTKSVTIPANVNMANGKITAVTPAFTINRTNWDVKYGSGLIGTAQDQLINDEVGLVITLVANAKG